MAPEDLRSASGWLLAGLAVAAVAFGLLVLAWLDLAAYAGLAASLLFVVGGFRLSGAMEAVPANERIRYPYHLAQRGRRLAWTALIGTVGLAGWAILGDVVAPWLGLTAVIVLGAAGLLAPAMILMLIVWTVDGIALHTGREEPGDPLVAATVSMTVVLLLAVVTTVTGYDVSFAILAALGGLLPTLFVLWALQRIRASLARPRIDPRG